MSYCRWSSDDHQCDIYAWQDVSGEYCIHVASSRRIFAEELPPHGPDDDIDAWIARCAKVLEMCEQATLEKIGLPHDGDSFSEATPGEAADRLLSLREVGYNVPQHAIDELREEEG